jgi:hypothetical protein
MEPHRESGRGTPVAISSFRVRENGPVSGRGSTENAQTVRRPAGGLFGASRQPVRSARRPHAASVIAGAGARPFGVGRSRPVDRRAAKGSRKATALAVGRLFGADRGGTSERARTQGARSWSLTARRASSEVTLRGDWSVLMSSFRAETRAASSPGGPSGSSGSGEPACSSVRRVSTHLPPSLHRLSGRRGVVGGCDEVLGLGRKLARCRGGLRIAPMASRGAEVVFGSPRGRRVWGRVPRGTRWCSLVRCRALRGVATRCGAAAVPLEARRGLASADLCALRGALTGRQLEAEFFGALPRARGRQAFPWRRKRWLEPARGRALRSSEASRQRAVELFGARPIARGRTGASTEVWSAARVGQLVSSSELGGRSAA